MVNIKQWNHDFSVKGALSFILNEAGMPMIEVRNTFATARIALQGGHVLNFQPHGEQPLLWLSDDAIFLAGKSVRGGIPVCWPWFGAHDIDISLPAHGYARTMLWQPIATSTRPDGQTVISLELLRHKQTVEFCAAPLALKLHIIIGKSLEITLETQNLGHEPFMLSEALHTYFLVGDVRQTYVEGLEDCVYLDKVEGFAQKQQLGAITIEEEVDRVYLQGGSCTVFDPSLQRKILINSQGSRATVVWNPWCDVADKMGDMGKDGYLKMLCVETANAASHVVRLAAGEKHQMSVVYQIEPLKG